MTLGDTLAPDRSATRAQEMPSALGRAAGGPPADALFGQADAALNAGFGRLFGSGGPEAREAVARAAAADGPAASGAVVGDHRQARELSGALEALDYSKAVYAAEQSGRG